MKNKISHALLLFFLLFSTASFAGIHKKSIHNSDKRYDITAYGAIGDGKTLNTKMIQAAIDECAKKGGTVVIPKENF